MIFTLCRPKGRRQEECEMLQSTPSNRREFLKAAGLSAAVSKAAGLSAAASIAGASLAPVAAAAPIETMKVGVFGLDYTFWTIWADLLSPIGKRVGTSLLRMRPAYVWDKDKSLARKFADQWECEVVNKFDGMVGKVDAVLNGELTNAPFQHLLLRPYIQAGIPCFLQRHWSDTLAHMDEMLDLAAKHSTPVMATVPFEHYG